MYCVKCGVSLEEGTAECPLCGTPVWNPDEKPRNTHYNPDLYPAPESGGKYTLLTVITLVMAGVALGCLIACLAVYGRPAWSGYVVLGEAFVYISLVLPFWFRRYYHAVFIPLSFLALGGYLLYINAVTGGHWFLPFAFPVTGMTFLVTFLGTGIALLRFRPRTKLLLIGLLFVLIGGFTMLLEFFLHITFNVRMFNWSLYSAGFFGLIGIFLFTSSLIKPLRRVMYKKLFI